MSDRTLIGVRRMISPIQPMAPRHPYCAHWDGHRKCLLSHPKDSNECSGDTGTPIMAVNQPWQRNATSMGTCSLLQTVPVYAVLRLLSDMSQSASLEFHHMEGVYASHGGDLYIIRRGPMHHMEGVYASYGGGVRIIR